MIFHHIGIAVSSISSEIEKIRKIHNVVSVSDIVYDELQEAELCMITLEDGLSLELISGKMVEGILKKKQSYYHICYQTDSFDEECDKLVSSGAMKISDKKNAILFNNKRVAFFYVSYGIIELVEG